MPCAVMVEHPPDDIFGHVLGEIVGDDLDDRHVGQAGIGENMVDAGADREDGAQIGQRRQQVRLLLPHHRIGDRRIAGAVRLQHHLALGRQQFVPALRMKAVTASRMRPFSIADLCPSFAIYWLTMPTGAVSILNAAEISALV